MFLLYNSLIGRHLLLALLLLGSACSCNRMFLYPQPTLLQTPATGNIDYDDVQIHSSDDIILHGWLLKPKVKSQGAVLFLHGNAENISTHISNIYWLPEYGYEVLLIDYRGYGQSQGEPCLPGIVDDVEASYHWFKSRAGDQQPLFIMGQSLGASLASYSVGQHPEWQLNGVILDSPFAGYQQIARDKMNNFWLTWPLQYPVSWLFSDTYSPYHNIDKISPRPLLIYYSKIDKVVPPQHSEALYESAKPPKWKVITEEPHIGTFNRPEYREQLLKFLQQNTNSR